MTSIVRRGAFVLRLPVGARVPWPPETPGTTRVFRETTGLVASKSRGTKHLGRGATTRSAPGCAASRTGRTRVTDDDVLEQVRVAHLA